MEDEKVLDAQEDVLEQEEESTSEEVVEEEVEETQAEEEVTISKAKFSAMQRKAIAYDASKKQSPQKPKEDITNNNVSADELKLIARGLSDELIEEAKVIAKGKGISLIEATQTDSFKVIQDYHIAEDKKSKAKLGASKGSGISKAELGFTSGLSKEEHFKKWQETVNK